MAFVIESGVPMPNGGRSGARAGPITEALRTLSRSKVGDSVFIPDKRPRDMGCYVASAAGKGWALSRSEGNGVRVWKVAEPNPPSKSA